MLQNCSIPDMTPGYFSSVVITVCLLWCSLGQGSLIVSLSDQPEQHGVHGVRVPERQPLRPLPQGRGQEHRGPNGCRVLGLRGSSPGNGGSGGHGQQQGRADAGPQAVLGRP